MLGTATARAVVVLQPTEEMAMNTVTVESTPALWERWGAGLGVPAIVLLVVSFVFAANGPDVRDSDATISSWYSSNSHQLSQMLGFVGFALGVLCLIGFLAALRDRAAAERTPGALCQIAFGAGVASAVLFTIAIALFTAPAFLAFDAQASDIAPASYRMFYSAAVVAWVGATMIAALTVTATSAVAFRTSFLPRWFAWLGAVVGIVQLLGFFFIPGFAFWGWILIASVLLLKRTTTAG
jgi:Domain of unknown function (DUF4386)